MILYLSGTGNTRWVAESIARMTGDERVVDIASVCSQPLPMQAEPPVVLFVNELRHYNESAVCPGILTGGKS